MPAKTAFIAFVLGIAALPPAALGAESKQADAVAEAYTNLAEVEGPLTFRASITSSDGEAELRVSQNKKFYYAEGKVKKRLPGSETLTAEQPVKLICRLDGTQT